MKVFHGDWYCAECNQQLLIVADYSRGKRYLLHSEMPSYPWNLDTRRCTNEGKRTELHYVDAVEEQP